MIYIQCEDGCFYSYPEWGFDKGRRIVVSDDGIFLYKKGDVLWKTARRNLPVALEAIESCAKHIIDGALLRCSVFRVSLTEQMPVPDSYVAKECLFGEYMLWDGKSYTLVQ